MRSNPADVASRLTLSDAYFGAGEVFAGIEQMEIARTLGDRDPQHLRALAQHYDDVGEPEVAAEVLASAGVNADLALPLAQSYLKLGDFQKSADALRPLRKQWTTLPVDAQQTVVRALLLAGDAQTAAPLLPHASADADWLALIGLQALVAGKPAQATTALGQALTLNPHDAWTGYLLGKAWLAAGDSKRALIAWGNVAQEQDPPPQALIGLARLLAQGGRLDQADEVLNHVHSEDRKLPAYWKTVALIARQRNHTAIEQIALGYAAYNEGDPWQAEADWRRALSGATDDLARQIYVALSNSAVRRQDQEAALRYAAAAAKRWPGDPESLRQYADMLLAQNQLKEALTVAERLQAIAPPERQAQAAEILQRIALDSSKPELLQQNAQRERTLSPGDPLPLLHLAEWQGQQGRDPANLERTLGLYQQASAIAPANADAMAHTGLLLADLKRNPEAIATLRHALTLNPRVLDGAPNALLAQLYGRQGLAAESRFEAQWYQRVRALKETWPTLLKTMRQEHPEPTADDWKALGAMALRRHENWIALCAATRGVRLAPTSSEAWQELAAAQKRFGWFDEALDSMRQAHLLSAGNGKRAGQ